MGTYLQKMEEKRLSIRDEKRVQFIFTPPFNIVTFSDAYFCRVSIKTFCMNEIKQKQTAYENTSENPAKVCINIFVISCYNINQITNTCRR